MITKKQWQLFINKYEFADPLAQASYINIHINGGTYYVSTSMNDRILSITRVTEDLLALEVLRYSFVRGFANHQIVILPLKRQNVEAIFYSYKALKRSEGRKLFRRNKKNTK